MDIALNFFGDHHAPLKSIARQLGISHAVCTVPLTARQSPYIEAWHPLALRSQVLEMESYGMRIAVLEGIKFIDAAKLGTGDCDQSIDNFCALLKNMSQAGIHTVCYNWMPVFGWFRSRLEVPARGGARATAFCSDDMQDVGMTSCGRVEGGMLWQTLEYFLSRVVPVAQQYCIKLALHPDDLALVVDCVGNLTVHRIAQYPSIHKAQIAQLPISLCLDKHHTEDLIDREIIGVLYGDHTQAILLVFRFSTASINPLR